MGRNTIAFAPSQQGAAMIPAERNRHSTALPLPGILPAMPPTVQLLPLQRPLRGIAYKVASTFVFTAMLACIKLVADRVPTGEIVFFRSALALVPIAIFFGWRGELALTLRTSNPLAHLWRGLCGVTSMALWFLSIALIPLPEALAIGYASPLITVVLAAVMLGEVVRAYRWSAVAFGFAGILLLLAPRLGAANLAAAGSREMLGAAAALGSAFFVSLAMVQLRRLTRTETTPAIVTYFSLTAIGLSFLTIPFGWMLPSPGDLALLVATGLLGGVGQVLLTEGYRHAEASAIASFDYTGMIWGLLLAWLMFGEVPDALVAAGCLVVVASGLFIIYRERTQVR